MTAHGAGPDSLPGTIARSAAAALAASLIVLRWGDRDEVVASDPELDLPGRLALGRLSRRLATPGGRIVPDLAAGAHEPDEAAALTALQLGSAACVACGAVSIGAFYGGEGSVGLRTIASLCGFAELAASSIDAAGRAAELERRLELAERGRREAESRLEALVPWLEANEDVTAQRIGSGLAELTEVRLRDFLDTASEWVWETDSSHRITFLSAAKSAQAVEPLARHGRTRWEVAGAQAAEERWDRHRADLDARLPFRQFVYPVRAADGHLNQVEISGNPVHDDSGGFQGYRGTGRFATERLATLAELAEMRIRLTALSGSGIIGIALGTGDRIEEANEAFLALVGCDDTDLAGAGLSWSEITPAEWRPTDARAAEDRLNGNNRPYEKEILHKDGRRLPVQVSMVYLTDAADRWMCLVQDLRERKRDEARIRELALVDPLTRLPNRRHFADELASIVAAPERCGALLFVDLDHFKDVNDVLGHDAGDGLLRDVAQRLRRSVRRGDLVARLGGDEFAIVLDGAPGPAEAGAVARKLMDALRQPFPHGDRVIHPSASIGIALFPRDGTDPAQLLKNADLALYRAKDQGRRAMCFFNPEMQQELESRLSLAADLRRAIEADEFVLVYQPIVHMDDCRHAGFEVLIRWAHPELGLLSPGAFLGSAEESGLIVPLGRTVLRGALRQLRRWLDGGLEPGRLSVNIAAAQLRSEGLAADVERWLTANGLEPERLTIEITENVLLETGEQIAPNLRRLNRLGVAIALDDFGTGYASLSHLKRFPVDVLKIDRSFVSNIGSDPEDAVIARTIINLAHSLDMEVVAEGIEAVDQLDFLRVNGCDFAQGYLLARPLDAAAVAGYLAAGRPTAQRQPVAPPSSGTRGVKSAASPRTAAGLSPSASGADLAH